MRRLVALSVAAVVAFAAPAAAKGGKPTPANVTVLTNGQAAGAVLALSDMPTGYTAITSRPNGTDAPCNGPNGSARAQTLAVAGTASSQFAQLPYTDPIIAESVYSFPSVQRAQAFVNATRTQVGSCSTFSSAMGGQTFNYSLTPIVFARVGDDTLATRDSISPPGVTIGSTDDQIVIRIGNNVVVLKVGERPGPDTALEQQYVGRAITKLGVEIQAAKLSTKKTGKKKGKS